MTRTVLPVRRCNRPRTFSRRLLPVMFAVAAVSLSSAVGRAEGAWEQTKTFNAKEAHQAAAADEHSLYAIDGKVIAQYDRKTGELKGRSSGLAVEHLNSGFLLDGKLYCAHSNYPHQPEQSQLIVLDPASMQLSVFKDFGSFGGSLTWAVRKDDAWWCNFAYYDDASGRTELVRFDDDWKETGRWTYPPEVLAQLGDFSSLSGGLWWNDTLLATHHHDPVLFQVKLPEKGNVLEYVGTLSAPFTGQGIAIDPVTGGLVGINRPAGQIVLAEQRDAPRFTAVTCEGTYPAHLQGVCCDDDSAIFWCFTTQLVKTDPQGKILNKIPVANHHGDLCYRDGKVYVAVNLGKFNRPAGEADSWVYVYDAATLKEVARHQCPDVVHGAGGIACDDDRFLVVGGLPEGAQGNPVYEYDADFKLQKTYHLTDAGYTLMGIQTADYFNGEWWFGCYGNPPTVLRAGHSLENVRRSDFNASVGIIGLNDGRILVARNSKQNGVGHSARLIEAVPDEDFGLALVPASEKRVPGKVTLPRDIYAVVGLETSIRFENIVPTTLPDGQRVVATCPLGSSDSEQWTFTAQAADVGQHRLVARILDGDGLTLATARTTLHVSPESPAAGRPSRLLIVGDSLTHATVWPNELARLMSQPGQPTWTMLGTHRPSSAKEGVAHEGYGGWTWQRFLAHYEPNPDGTYRKRSSPFVYLGKDDRPELDVPRYIAENCEGRPPEAIIILLGINDLFSADSENLANLDERIDGMFATAESLMSAFRKAAPEAVIGVCLTPPPNAREEAFEANYNGRYPQAGWQRIQRRLVQRQLAHFSGREAELIQVIPIGLSLNPMTGYPDNNSVHPNAEGYADIGRSVFAWLQFQPTQPDR